MDTVVTLVVAMMYGPSAYFLIVKNYVPYYIFSLRIKIKEFLLTINLQTFLRVFVATNISSCTLVNTNTNHLRYLY